MRDTSVLLKTKEIFLTNTQEKHRQRELARERESERERAKTIYKRGKATPTVANIVFSYARARERNCEEKTINQHKLHATQHAKRII